MFRLFFFAFIYTITCTGCGPSTTPVQVQDMNDMSIQQKDMTLDMKKNLEKKPGDNCDSPLECGPAMHCASANGRFQCMLTCKKPYTICDGGQVCTALMGGQMNVCFPGGSLEPYSACQTNLACPSGFLCLGTSTERYCIEACHKTQSTCPLGHVCQITTDEHGFCHQATGTLCNDNANCTTDLICSKNAVGASIQNLFPRTICTNPNCDSDSDCAGSSRCIQINEAGQKTCINTCKTDANCIFAQDFRCTNSAICGQSTNPTMCLKWIGEAKLCIHKDAVF